MEKTKTESIIYNPFFISFIVIAIGVAIFFYFQDNKEEVTDELSEDIVATVNDEPILREKFEQQLDLAPEGTSEEDLLNQMIQNKLLFQEALSQGITATEEEINNQYDQIAQQFETQEEFQQILNENNTSEEDLKETLREQIIFEKYSNFLQQENEISVSEEEIENFYEENKESLAGEGEEVPSLEEAKLQIEQYLLQQKLNSVISEIVQDLYNSATIETSL